MDALPSFAAWSKIEPNFSRKMVLKLNNLFVTSKDETTNSPIHQFTNLKCCIKARESFKPFFDGVFFLIYYFKKHFMPCFFIIKTFFSTLNS